MALLSEEQVHEMLQKAPQWTRTGKEISRSFQFKNFREALAFVVHVGLLAERLNHHPHIAIDYKKVVLTLTTHSEGGLTEKDFEMVRQIDAIA
jgi:4a-hydroxytetrahydrobiopterin dehydratase